MNSKEFTYVSLGTEKAASLRKNTLKLEMDFLRIMQKILTYKLLRKSENQGRITLKRKLDEISEEMKNILLNLPKVETQQIKEAEEERELVKKPEVKEVSKKLKGKEVKEGRKQVEPKAKPKSAIESKLDEIKRKLAELGENV